MGEDQSRNGPWDRVRALAEKLDSPHADKVYVSEGYTKADLRRDLLATIPAQMPPFGVSPAIETQRAAFVASHRWDTDWRRIGNEGTS